MGLTVVTYGGGEILKNIFDAVAMLFNSQGGGLIKPLVVISASIGALWAILKAFLANSAQPFIAQYFLPLALIVGLFMVPSTTVHIEDILRDHSYTVSHVPFLLGKFSELTSSMGYQITKGVEKAMHVPNDVSYNATGRIFGADSALDISRYQITNANLEKNLRLFSKQCVLFDISLGRYTIDDMKKTTDLWKFFEAKTSKVRMIRYQPITSSNHGNLGEYLSCNDAIKRMAPYLEQEKRYYGQLDVCRNLPFTFQALTGMQKNKEELVSQQLMMNVLLDEYGGQNFAKARAYLQQRNTYQVLGSLAANSLVTLRAVLEALVYASFIFVLPLSVLPGGIKFITTWAGLVLWIQLWPPFYAILNYVMQTVAHGYSESIFAGVSSAHQGLSLFTSVGLHNLQQDIFALSGYLAASIPFITYAILKGGVGSFIHLASSMMSPAHSAATSAAAEQTAGNYSFGNASFGQTSYQNTTGLHTNLAPSLTGGHFSENRGSSSAIYGQGEQILKQSNSELRTSVFSDESISQSLQSAQMHAQSNTESCQDSYSENIVSNSRHLADLSNHLGKSESYGEGFSEREAHDMQNSARYFQNISENWGKQNGLSSRQSLETLFGLGIDFGVQAKSSTAFGSNKERALSAASGIVKSEEFQKNFQHLQDFSKSNNYNSLDEKGARLVEGYSQSSEQLRNSQQTYQSAQNTLDQVSENTTWAQQNSHQIRRSLNQDFVNWASEKYADEGGFAKVEHLLSKGDSREQEALVQNFVSFVKQKSPSLDSPQDYVKPDASRPQTLPKNLSRDDAETALNSMISSHAHRFSEQMPLKRKALVNKFTQAGETDKDNFSHVASKIETTRKRAIDDYQKESDRSLLKRSFDEAPRFEESHPLAASLKKMNFMKKWLPNQEAEKAYANNFQITEETFWMKQEDRR